MLLMYILHFLQECNDFTVKSSYFLPSLKIYRVINWQREDNSDQGGVRVIVGCTSEIKFQATLFW